MILPFATAVLFHIPTANRQEQLLAFADQAQVSVLYETDITYEWVETRPGFDGTLEPRDALAMILTGIHIAGLYHTVIAMGREAWTIKGGGSAQSYFETPPSDLAYARACPPPGSPVLCLRASAFFCGMSGRFKVTTIAPATRE